jgi:hypothetical protein
MLVVRCIISSSGNIPTLTAYIKSISALCTSSGIVPAFWRSHAHWCGHHERGWDSPRGTPILREQQIFVCGLLLVYEAFNQPTAQNALGVGYSRFLRFG